MTQLSFWKMLFGGRVKPVLATAFAFILFAVAIFYYANSKSVVSSQLVSDAVNVNTPFDIGVIVSEKTTLSGKQALKRESGSRSLRRAVPRRGGRTHV